MLHLSGTPYITFLKYDELSRVDVRSLMWECHACNVSLPTARDMIILNLCHDVSQKFTQSVFRAFHFQRYHPAQQFP
jgi:hypothetical protein